jgi:hypothetical protein
MQRSSFSPLFAIASAWSAASEPLPALAIARGAAEQTSTGRDGRLRMMDLNSLMAAAVSANPELARSKVTLVNVGAADRNDDPIYRFATGAPARALFPQGMRVIGYECDPAAAESLRVSRPFVEVVRMCVNTSNLVADLATRNVPSSFPVLKVDIDSVDAPVLDSILRRFRPLAVYAEIVWDFPPPIDFALVRVGPPADFHPGTRGCFGMSLHMAHRVLARHGYRIAGAGALNVLAVAPALAHAAAAVPSDPWFWFQFISDGFANTHYYAPAGWPALEGQRLSKIRRRSIKTEHARSPLRAFGTNVSLYESVRQTAGYDGFDSRRTYLPIRTMDGRMRALALMIGEGCRSQGATYLLAVGDRCCAPQWVGDDPRCVCSLDPPLDLEHR